MTNLTKDDAERGAIERELARHEDNAACAESCGAFESEAYHSAIAKVLRDALAARIREAQGGGNYVHIPKSADQAALMYLFGHKWLKEHAPERLTNIAQGGDRGIEPSEDELVRFVVDAALQGSPVKTIAAARGFRIVRKE